MANLQKFLRRKTESILKDKNLLWNILFSFSIALSLVSYRSVDAIFTLFYILGFSAGLRHFSVRFYFRRNFFNLLILAFFISCSLGYFLVDRADPDRWDEIFQLRWILGFYGAYYAGTRLQSHGGMIKLNSLLIPSVLVYLFVQNALQSERGLFNSRQRFQGFYQHANHFALTVVLLWAFYLAFILVPNKEALWNRVVKYVTLGLLSLVLFASYSRTSWIGAVVTLGIALAYTKNKKAFMVSGAVAIIAGFFFFTNAFEFKDRILYSLNTSQSGSQGTRILAWKANWNIFLDHPLFGVGIEGARKHYPKYYEKLGFAKELIVGNAHNQYLQLLSGAGILGLLSYMAIFFSGLFFFHRMYFQSKSPRTQQVALGGLLVIIALLASSFTDAPFRLHEVRNYVLLLLGVVVGFIQTAFSFSKNEHEI